MSTTDSGGRVRYVWLLRVPILSAGFLIGLPFMAFSGGLRPYLSGLFDPVSPSALVLITGLALLNAWTVAIIAGLVVRYGGVRFDLPRLRSNPDLRCLYVLSSGLAAPVIAHSMLVVSDAPGVTAAAAWLWSSLGAALAIVLLGVAYGVSLVIARQAGRDYVPAQLTGAYRGALEWLSKYPALASGFLDPHSPPARLAPGHGFAFGLALASVVLYLGTGYVTRNVQRPEYQSALAYLLLLQLMVTWLVGFAAFMFDRSRAPITVFALVWIVIVNTVIDPWFPTDHIYRTIARRDAVAAVTPEDLFGGGAPAIVVAASGGGIRAAAWTARVLTGLDQVPGFRSHVRLVSAVSGGSVGAMNTLASWPQCGPEPGAHEVSPADFDPNAASRESSLHAVGWGLVFKDLPRTLAPFFSAPFVDRGSVLEDAWKREARLKRPYPDTGPMLASWRRNVRERLCPGAVFNAMSAETGEPMLFATTGLPGPLQSFDFYKRYPGRDLPLTTAVRLSAAFPYVSPASRADVDDDIGSYTHVVDGGYFDNYGISTLVATVHAGLQAAPSASGQLRRVLIIEVCDSAKCSGEESNGAIADGGDERAWTYQLRAPLSAVMAMRSAAQRATNRSALRLLKGYWNSNRKTCIESLQAAFGQRDGPMSWHLTWREKQAVDEAWSERQEQLTQQVTAFLGGQAVTAEPCTP